MFIIVLILHSWYLYYKWWPEKYSSIMPTSYNAYVQMAQWNVPATSYYKSRRESMRPKSRYIAGSLDEPLIYNHVLSGVKNKMRCYP